MKRIQRFYNNAFFIKKLNRCSWDWVTLKSQRRVGLYRRKGSWGFFIVVIYISANKLLSFSGTSLEQMLSKSLPFFKLIKNLQLRSFANLVWETFNCVYCLRGCCGYFCSDISLFCQHSPLHFFPFSKN